MIEDLHKKEFSFKQKAKLEFRKFLICFIYLALFFCSFIFYRNLILSDYSLSYFHYGFGILEALVIAKVILLGQTLRLGDRMFEDYPLLFPSIYKAFVFSLFVLAFSILEHYISGFLHGKNLAEINLEFISTGKNEILSRTLIKFVAFVPFFAFLELDIVFGEGKVYQLFFRKRKDNAD